MRHLELRAGDAESLEAELRTLSARAGAEAVVLLDMSGVVLSSFRVPDKIDGLQFAALLSSNFAATEELSRHLGVTAFKVMYHEGRKQNLYFEKVDEETVLVVLFKDSNAMGRVRLFCEKSVPEVIRLLRAVTRAAGGAAPSQARAAAAALADVARAISPARLGNGV